MTFALSTPVTGLAQTGFTTPTYTIVQDTSPDVNAKQYAVTALGGTQAGVTTHAVSSPFSTNMWRPKVFQSLGKPNPSTGLISRVPRNTYKLITRKGVTVLAGQPIQNLTITTIIEVPAGSDVADAPNIRAALSLHGGALAQAPAGIGDTLVLGVL
ncbi:TPA_asm: coat protein [ssRNA phage Gephyllon.2_13]|uniref:Coat protein n=2 Tax=Norzivirales TaxID=2842247 RepID=A0A8S5KY18_9VIRU|nr:coat protein [ssRNA phage Gephyllon.2_13]QDH90317.1 MAG: hypothetical protein H2BulkLitter12630_000002 [Leviviridae sp.]DAD50067.1 TPA_asm: coat protein [ssRNA phage Gephyllon.2_13]